MGLTTITAIPKIMRAKTWLNGATLMERWFTGASAVKPAYATPDLSTVQMDTWVLKFPRANAVFNAMISGKVWSNDQARPLMATRLTSLGLLPARGSICFDLSYKDVIEQHKLHVNFRQVSSSMWDPLDDMVAALANFSIYVTPLSGEIVPEAGRARIKLTRLGFHIMDSYDFEGSQDLGYWDEKKNEVSTHFFIGGTPVGNDTFRKWRTDHGRGSDFQVYSDVKIVNLPTPDSVLL